MAASRGRRLILCFDGTWNTPESHTNVSRLDRKSTRLNSSHGYISYAVFCLKKKKLRSENDLGVGDVAVLREFIDWAAEIGFKLVQLLPINEMGGDNSPHNAVSAIAIEPTTLHLAPGSPEDLTHNDYESALVDVDLTKLR